MQLTEHKPGNYHYIRKVDADGLLIDDTLYQASLIIGARLLQTDWPVSSFADLDETTIAPLIEHQPEVVLLGVGQTQSFPAIEIQRRFLQHGIGLECMTLPAACRTFNVLMSENRRALAGLIL
jgi:uncharacterized protein